MSDRFHIGAVQVNSGERVELCPEESRHLLRVMRARAGAVVGLFGGGREYQARLCGEGSPAVLEIISEIPALPEPGISVTAAIPWIKGGRTELVIQKLTELGVHGFIVFHALREVVRADTGKLMRLRRVVLEACKQSGRANVPLVVEAADLVDVFQSAGIGPGASFLLHEQERVLLFTDALRAAGVGPGGKSPPILVASGPEGGLDPAETGRAREHCTPVTLGARILRAETAPVAAMVAALAVAGEM